MSGDDDDLSRVTVAEPGSDPAHQLVGNALVIAARLLMAENELEGVTIIAAYKGGPSGMRTVPVTIARRGDGVAALMVSCGNLLERFRARVPVGYCAEWHDGSGEAKN